jgi:hypothetical protein
METNANGIDTGLIDCGCKPIYVGDKFVVKRHQNECCEHNVICEIRVDPTCRCGYGLYEVGTDNLIANAAIANIRYEEKPQGEQGLIILEPPIKLVIEKSKYVVRVYGKKNNDVGLRMGTDFEAEDINAVLEFAKELYKLAYSQSSDDALNKKSL